MQKSIQQLPASSRLHKYDQSLHISKARASSLFMTESFQVLDETRETIPNLRIVPKGLCSPLAVY